MTTYLQDSEGKFIPASQRPDGTWRKARRVKDGYVPQEEVPLYESKGKLFARKPAGPVGISPEEVQANKEKRLKLLAKQQAEQAASAASTQSNNRIPGIINTKPNNNAINDKQPTKPKAKVKNEQKAKKEPKTQHAPTTTIATTTETSPPHTTENNLNSATETFSNLTLDPQTELAKKLKKLKKKIREIEAIELKLSSGELKNPEKDQLDKVGRKQEILKQISDLEKTS